jgi:hypothetical protein
LQQRVLENFLIVDKPSRGFKQPVFAVHSSLFI